MLFGTGEVAAVAGWACPARSRSSIACASGSNAFAGSALVDDGAAVTNETHYMEVLVSKDENQDGGANDVRKLAFDLAICRQPVIVAPT